MDNIVALRPRQPTTQKPPYVGYGLAMPTKDALNITMYRYNEGARFQVDNAKLMRTMLLDDQTIALVFNHCLIELRGRNLDSLLIQLQYYRLSFVEVFAPDYYVVPPDDAPYIEAIRWGTVIDAGGQLLFPSYREDTPMIVFE